MNKESILAKTLSDIQEIKKGIEKNANHVLRSTLKNDLEEIIRKGLNENDKEYQTDDMVSDTDAPIGDTENPTETSPDDGLNIDPTVDVDSEELEPNDDVEPGDQEVIDLTGETDDDLITHFNLMDPTDEIEVIKTPNGGIQINIGGKSEEDLQGQMAPEDEFEPNPDEEISPESEEEKGEEEEEEEEVVYEIEINENEVITNAATKHIKSGEGSAVNSGNPYTTKASITDTVKKANGAPAASSAPFKGKTQVKGGETIKNAATVNTKTTGAPNDSDPYKEKATITNTVKKAGTPASMGNPFKKTSEPAGGEAIKNASTANTTKSGTPQKSNPFAKKAPVGKDVLHEEDLEETPNIKAKEVQHAFTGKTVTKEEELHESLISMRRKIQALMTESKNKSKELDKVQDLVADFKSNEGEYKEAIKNLKGQLQEVALFTSNLTYAVKLMTENSTTKDEKLNILKKFDSATTLNESRNIFEGMETLLVGTKNSPDKIIESKILEKSKSSGASQLNESTAYKNPQLSRMLDIIQKLK